MIDELPVQDLYGQANEIILVENGPVRQIIETRRQVVTL